MSSIDTSSEGGGHKKGPGVKKAKKLSTRIDMTPMVDLGVSINYFFYFHYYHVEPNYVEIEYAKRYRQRRRTE